MSHWRLRKQGVKVLILYSQNGSDVGFLSHSPKRRRIPGSITQNACLSCKKARTKVSRLSFGWAIFALYSSRILYRATLTEGLQCDGQQPCRRCTSRTDTPHCIYQAHIRRTKEQLITKIDELEKRIYCSEQILRALSGDRDTSAILTLLRNGATYERVANWLGQTNFNGIGIAT